jgi:ribosomal protein S18 acetylase RimI-like enzyme
MPSVDAPIPPVPAAANLPSESSIRPIADSDVQALRRINALLLPVSYSDSFYARAVDPAASARFSRVITWQHQGQEPKVVGGLVCRLEPLVDGPYASTGRDAALSSPPQGLYIQSLCLLSPYRGLGLINAAVDNIVATAVADPKLDVRVLTAHVWTENEDGLRWYDGRRFKRQGQPISGYYLKLRPDSAWLVQRPIAAFVRSSLPSPASAGSTPNNISNNGISGMASPRPPLMSPHGQSFQNQRAETEWNDLPADMAPTMLAPPKKVNSEPGFTASSRSSSTVRRKKDRSYPAAAFGS